MLSNSYKTFFLIYLSQSLKEKSVCFLYLFWEIHQYLALWLQCWNSQKASKILYCQFSVIALSKLIFKSDIFGLCSKCVLKRQVTVLINYSKKTIFCYVEGVKEIVNKLIVLSIIWQTNRNIFLSFTYLYRHNFVSLNSNSIDIYISQYLYFSNVFIN